MGHEFIHRVAVKVLRWDNVISTPRGLLLLRIHDTEPEVLKDPTTNQFLSIGHKTSGCSHRGYHPPFDTLFPLQESFTCGDSNHVQQLFLEALSSRDIFHPDNHEPLSEIIMEDFLSCFHFPTTYPNSPNIVYVVVVEVWRRFVIIGLSAASFPDESDLAESSSDHHEEEKETGKGHKRVKSHHEEEETDRSRKRIKSQEEIGESSDIIAQEEDDDSYSETQLRDISLSLKRKLRYVEKFGIFVRILADDQLFQVTGLRNAVKMSTFNGRCRKSEEEDQCSVCLEGYRDGQQIAKMPCSHIFHRNCAFEWLPRHGSCPLCRSVCTVSIYS